MPQDDAPNAWLVAVPPDKESGGLSIAIDHRTHGQIPGVKEGDGVVITDRPAGEVSSFARIYRVRRSSDATILYFDGLVRLASAVSAVSLQLTPPNAAIERLPW